MHCKVLAVISPTLDSGSTHRIGCEILNKMAALGMPDTYCAGWTLQPAQGGQRFAPGRATTPPKRPGEPVWSSFLRDEDLPGDLLNGNIVVTLYR